MRECQMDSRPAGRRYVKVFKCRACGYEIEACSPPTRECAGLSTPAAGQVQVAARIANEAAMNRLRAEAAESKLTALLDGIEGLEADLRARERFRNDIADDLKALREKAK